MIISGTRIWFQINVVYYTFIYNEICLGEPLPYNQKNTSMIKEEMKNFTNNIHEACRHGTSTKCNTNYFKERFEGPLSPKCMKLPYHKIDM